jgi:hypothetical protein
MIAGFEHVIALEYVANCYVICDLLQITVTIRRFLRPKCPGATLLMRGIAADNALRWLLFLALNLETTQILLASLFPKQPRTKEI